MNMMKTIQMTNISTIENNCIHITHTMQTICIFLYVYNVTYTCSADKGVPLSQSLELLKPKGLFHMKIWRPLKMVIFEHFSSGSDIQYSTRSVLPSIWQIEIVFKISDFIRRKSAKIWKQQTKLNFWRFFPYDICKYI